MKEDFLFLVGLAQCFRHLIHRFRQTVKFRVTKAEFPPLEIAVPDFLRKGGQVLYRLRQRSGYPAAEKDGQRNPGQNNPAQHQIDPPGKGLNGRHVHITYPPQVRLFPVTDDGDQIVSAAERKRPFPDRFVQLVAG